MKLNFGEYYRVDRIVSLIDVPDGEAAESLSLMGIAVSSYDSALKHEEFTKGKLEVCLSDPRHIRYVPHEVYLKDYKRINWED